MVRAWVLVEKLEVEYLSIGVNVNPSPIFVLGNQKSGTSAISMLLGELSGLSVTKDFVKGWLYKDQPFPFLKSGKKDIPYGLHP